MGQHNKYRELFHADTLVNTPITGAGTGNQGSN